MISGKDWMECEFLVDAMKNCKVEALEDEAFGTFKFDYSMRCCLKRHIKEWTWVECEQESLLEQMLEDVR